MEEGEKKKTVEYIRSLATRKYECVGLFFVYLFRRFFRLTDSLNGGKKNETKRGRIICGRKGTLFDSAYSGKPV